MRVDPRFNVEVTHVNFQPQQGAVSSPAETIVEPKLPTDASRMTQGIRSQRSWPKTKFNQPPALDPDRLKLSDAWRNLRREASEETGVFEEASAGGLADSWDRLLGLVFGPQIHQTKAQERFQQAVSLIKEGNDKEAMRLLRKVLEIEPEHAEAHALLGHQALLAERYEEAERHLQHAASYNPADYSLQMDLGELYYQLGEPELARQAFSQAARTSVRHSDPQAWLGLMAYEAGDMAGAARCLERAVQLDPTHAIARYYLAQVAFQLNDPLRANYQLQVVKQLQPTADLERFESAGFSLPSGVPKPLETRRWQFPSI